MKYILHLHSLSLALILLSFTTLSSQENINRPDFIIDAHIHYKNNPEWENSFVQVYTKYKAMGCVLVKMEDLEDGIRFAKEHPELVIPYAMIDINSPTVLDDIRRVQKMGFQGLGELFATEGWNYDDPKYDSIWILAEKFDLVLLPHTGIHSKGNFSGMRPAFVASIAQKHRDLAIHAAHFGNPWYAEAGEAARLNPNLYFDITGSSLIKKDADPGFWGQFLWWTPYLGYPHVGSSAEPAWNKIVFGTDEDASEEHFLQNIIRFNKMLDANHVPQENRQNMYGRTIARMHGIKTVHGFPVN